MHPKNKIIAGLFAVAFIVLLALGLLFYSLSDNGSVSTKNITPSASQFATAKAENTEAKDAPHFSIFSILNKLIPN